jgi:tetratricopeptide (TPR) repeat protein
VISQDLLDELWDFADPKGSEQRLRAADTNRFALRTDRNELATQIARALGMQSRFAEALDLLDRIDDGEPVVLARILLERGRVMNAGGRRAEAVSLFEDAAHLAAEIGHDFMTVDAMRMVGQADPSLAEEWAESGLAVIARSKDPRLDRWARDFRTDLGDAMYDGGADRGASVRSQQGQDSGQ